MSTTSTSGAADNGAAPKAGENRGEDYQASPTQQNGPARTLEEDNLDDMGTFNNGPGKDYMSKSEYDVSLGPKTSSYP